jgi:hypothetical protein
MNIFFAVFFCSCVYFYYLCMIEDPGFVPKGLSRMQQKAVVDELLSLWKFDDQNFCVQCMVRTPLRSKHCKRCKRCVAKHDQYVLRSRRTYVANSFSHCPWVHNCVGANNLRHFYLYIASLEVGIILFLRLVLSRKSCPKSASLYRTDSGPDLENTAEPAETKCNVLSEEICKWVLRDTFTVVLTIWAALQLTWVTALLFVQSVQISRATTTYESMRGHHHGGSKIADTMTAVLTSGASSTEGAQLPSMQPGGGAAGGQRHAPAHARKEGCFAQWKKLLGLDTFVATAQSGTRRPKNPYSRGIITNCKDFWCDPAPIFGQRPVGDAMLDGEMINYTRIYEVPPRMKARRGGNYESVGTEEV